MGVGVEEIKKGARKTIASNETDDAIINTVNSIEEAGETPSDAQLKAREAALKRKSEKKGEGTKALS